jgi:hypothetical protein
MSLHRQWLACHGPCVYVYVSVNVTLIPMLMPMSLSLSLSVFTQHVHIRLYMNIYSPGMCTVHELFQYMNT